MSDTLLNRRYANSSDIELINMAIDDGYDSLAYALACRLEANLAPDESEVTEENIMLERQVDDLECQVCTLEHELESLGRNEDKLKAIVARASESVADALKLINPK